MHTVDLDGDGLTLRLGRQKFSFHYFYGFSIAQFEFYHIGKFTCQVFSSAMILCQVPPVLAVPTFLSPMAGS